jgi:hypothetical protein
MNSLKDLKYFPILRTRQAEMTGYAKLGDDLKDYVCPLINLGKWRNTDGHEKAIAKIGECLGNRKYILDLSKEIQHQNDAVRKLLSPDSNFKNWIDFIDLHENVIPVVQFTAGAKSREIVRQAVQIERKNRNPVFRIRDFNTDLDHTLAALYALDRPSEALIILDAGYIREISTKMIKPGILESIIRTLNKVVEEVPETPRVLAGTSFPRSVTPFLDEGKETSGKIDMLEHTLYNELGPDIVAYGDHASIHSVVYDDEGGTFLPRLDVPEDDFWYFERRPKTKGEGYIDAAQCLLRDHPFLEVDTSWGAEMIRNTAANSGTTINAPVTAISVRVNLHLKNQINNISKHDELPEDDDWLN